MREREAAEMMRREKGSGTDRTGSGERERKIKMKW